MVNYFYIPLALLLVGAQAKVIGNNEPARKCSYRWTANNGTCYLIEKSTRRTFERAKSRCESESGALFVPQSLEEDNFVMSQIAEMAFTWTGLSQKKEAPTWDHSSTVNISKLNWDEPYSAQRNCTSTTPDRCAVAENIHGKRKLYWTSCTEEHFFICEEKNKTEIFFPPPVVQHDEPVVNNCCKSQQTTQAPVKKTNKCCKNKPVVQQPIAKKTVKCDDGWVQYGNSCYFVERHEKETFYSAQRECKWRNATLFKPTSWEYKTILSNTVSSAHTWTDLPASSYRYYYDAETEYAKNNLNWLINPYDATSNGYNSYTSATCAAYYNGATRYYYYYPCDWKFLYICEKKLPTC